MDPLNKLNVFYLKEGRKKISHIPKTIKYINVKTKEIMGIRNVVKHWEHVMAYLEIFLLKMADVCRKKWSNRRALSRY